MNEKGEMDPFQGSDELESQGTSLGFGCTLLIHLKEKKKRGTRNGFCVSSLTTYHDLNVFYNLSFAGRTFPKCI